ncbi:MAG: DNA polymerase III subunit alpha [Gemmatimonadota bacterium]|nr:MAG: DNA polymerase III subunit alpha [Gemmatimonadota bacterium]
MPSYAELHCHSAFSLLDGASTPEVLVQRAVELGIRAVALTDHDDLGGAVRFSRAAREAGLEAIVGAELTIVPPEDAAGPPSHLTLLARTAEGYANLSELVTRGRSGTAGTLASCRATRAGMCDGPPRSKCPLAAPAVPSLSRKGARPESTSRAAITNSWAPDRGRPRVTWEDLAELGAGVFALTGCPQGELARRVRAGDGKGARELLDFLRSAFHGYLAVEVWDHALPEERALADCLLELADRQGLPAVATNDVHYVLPSGRIVHDLLTCLRHQVTLDEAGTRLRPNGEWHLKPPSVVWRRWRQRPDVVENTHGVAAECSFRLADLSPAMPGFQVPPGVTTQEYLERLVWRGALERYGGAGQVRNADPIRISELVEAAPPRLNGGSGLRQRVRRQIRHELEVIKRLDLAGYFLTVWDIVRFARRQGILLQGRGSAANSCVCYCLGITAVDPIKFELLFERFLSEERGGAPDIDLDIEHEQREEVLQYVYRKYGRERAAMVCETITYRGRSAVRDAARVLGFSTDVADRLAAEVERCEAVEAADVLENGGLAACGLDPRDRRVAALVHVVRGLDQLPRHRSIHVGGFVLTAGPLSRIVPIEPAAMPERTVIQWDKDDLDFVGLIKIDLLGLGMLTCLAKAIRYIRETRGVAINLAQLPAGDPEVYRMIQQADTVGVFQIESRAQMNSLPRLKPGDFYDLVVQVALIRPGPIQGEMVHPYVRRRRGEEPVTYLHPDLEPILKRTLGVPLFQEQGMKVAVAMANFTPGQADALRRAMGFKRSREAMALIEPALRAGMTVRGITTDVQDQIVKQLTAFANYGFPESHAASFALLVYASAYLKRYYAPEFYCALLNAQPMGFYAPGTLVHDARRHGVEVRPVDLVYSSWDCTLEPGIEEDGVRQGRLASCRAAPWTPAAPLDSDREGAEWGSSRSMSRGSVAGTAAAPPPRSKLRSRTPTPPLESRDGRDAAGDPRADSSSRKGGRGTDPSLHVARPGQRHVTVRGAPNVRSWVGAAPDRPALRIGLRYVRGLGSKAEEKLKAAWEAGGPFRSVEDVVRRSGLGLPSLKTLAEAGAFRTLWGPGRRSALWEMLAKLAQRPLAPVDSAPHPYPHPKLKEMTRIELIAADYLTTGLCTHGHPMEHLRATLRAHGVVSAEELRRVRSGQRVKVAGVVICRQRPGTAKGVCFITLEDETGFSNFVVYADLFQRYRRTIVRSPVLLIEGIAQHEQDVINVQARRIAAIEPTAGADVIESHDFH